MHDLWRLGCKTCNSCQESEGHGRRVWIEFASPEDASPFLSAVAGEYNDDIGSLYNRVMYGGSHSLDVARRHGSWEYALSLIDHNLDQDWAENRGLTERVIGPPAVRFRVSVAFPRTNLAEVEARLRNARRARAGR
jgi:hypothetical protein